MDDNKKQLLEKLNKETSKIVWSELQRFFASGNAIFVDEQLDLIEVAAAFSLDNKKEVENWMELNLVALVNDEQAGQWIQEETTVWAVVVKPWVLVQDKA